MAPTLVASRTVLPPEGAASPWGGPAAKRAPTLVATPLFESASRTPRGLAGRGSRDASPLSPVQTCSSRLGAAGSSPSGANFPWGGPAAKRARARGFTLIELLVAIGVMALMAGLSWRGLDGMTRAQAQIQQRADEVLTLQAGLAQWAADLDAVVQLPKTQALDWDGRGLRITRRSTGAPGDGLLVVAWTRRSVDGIGQWLRWQSPLLLTRGELQAAWARAAQWAQNPGDDEKKYEVRIAALEQWQVFYFRRDAWTHPLSSDGTTPAQGTGNPVAADLTLPDGVRLVLTLPPGKAISGILTRDWIRPSFGGGKS